jgi:hypothetical protein
MKRNLGILVLGLSALLGCDDSKGINPYQNCETTKIYVDKDSDGYGTTEGEICIGVEIPNNFALQPGDCDDNRKDINPSMKDLCNGLDDDCNEDTLDGSGENPPLNNNQEGVCAGYSQSCISGLWQDDITLIPTYEEIESICDLIDNDCDGITDQNMDFDNDGLTYCAGDVNNSCEARGTIGNVLLTFTTNKTQYNPGEEISMTGVDTSLTSWVDTTDLTDIDNDGCINNDIDTESIHSTTTLELGMHTLHAWIKDQNESYQTTSTTIIVKPHAEFDEVQPELEMLDVESFRTFLNENLQQNILPFMSEPASVTAIDDLMNQSENEYISSVIFTESNSLVYRINTTENLFHRLGNHYFGKVDLDVDTGSQMRDILSRTLPEEEGISVISSRLPSNSTLYHNQPVVLFDCGQANFDVNVDYQVRNQDVFLHIEYGIANDKFNTDEEASLSCFQERYSEPFIPLQAVQIDASSTYDLSLRVDEILDYIQENVQ